ncbi:hypothetical protein AM461_10360 [Providencia rettgeri]|nr:hypothetical protein AM461_10360 [Providencia rettgeri]
MASFSYPSHFSRHIQFYSVVGLIQLPKSLFPSYSVLQRCWPHSATQVTFPVIFSSTALLASFSYPSHILMYAPRDIFILPPSCRPDYLGKTV